MPAVVAVEQHDCALLEIQRLQLVEQRSDQMVSVCCSTATCASSHLRGMTHGTCGLCSPTPRKNGLAAALNCCMRVTAIATLAPSC